MKNFTLMDYLLALLNIVLLLIGAALIASGVYLNEWWAGLGGVLAATSLVAGVGHWGALHTVNANQE